MPLEVRVKTALPNFGYQVQLGSGDVEKRVKSKDQIRSALNAMYGGRGPNGEFGFSIKNGFIFENLPKIGPSPLLTSDVWVSLHICLLE